MVFSSTVFLFLFLPTVWLLYLLIPSKSIIARNVLLGAASLVFYAYGEPIVLFKASESGCCDAYPMHDADHYVTDGPFMYRSKTGELFMIWSSFIKGAYVELTVKFAEDALDAGFVHMPPLYTKDGGHGMLFHTFDNRLFFTFHSPNASGSEHPCFLEIEDKGDVLEAK